MELRHAPNGQQGEAREGGSVNPTFMADQVGVYEVQLVVNDGLVDSAPDTVVIVTETFNTAPVADAGADQSVRYGQTVQLNGTASSDADGDPLSFSWAFVSRPAGSQATLLNPTGPTPTLVADRWVTSSSAWW